MCGVRWVPGSPGEPFSSYVTVSSLCRTPETNTISYGNCSRKVNKIIKLRTIILCMPSWQIEARQVVVGRKTAPKASMSRSPAQVCPAPWRGQRELPAWGPPWPRGPSPWQRETEEGRETQREEDSTCCDWACRGTKGLPARGGRWLPEAAKGKEANSPGSLQKGRRPRRRLEF